MSQVLSKSLLLKIEDSIELTQDLISRVPPERLGWAPPYPNSWTIEVLLYHLVESVSGFCAVLAAVYPNELSDFADLRESWRSGQDPRVETSNRISLLQSHVQHGFSLLDDSALADVVPTVFLKQGETVLSLMLHNLEHLLNHKHQLFLLLKLLGVPMSSADLYRFRADH